MPKLTNLIMHSCIEFTTLQTGMDLTKIKSDWLRSWPWHVDEVHQLIYLTTAL